MRPSKISIGAFFDEWLRDNYTGSGMAGNALRSISTLVSADLQGNEKRTCRTPATQRCQTLNSCFNRFGPSAKGETKVTVSIVTGSVEIVARNTRNALNFDQLHGRLSGTETP